eukprot:TRINITY_DN45141_c0_g1_i1.p6 TRINITY_DN45141_c0_g1~~TRINITY_DN45141_c0_g1_i1.p6  ORF type:complete len:101 (+),score=14.98 TRINITY_DN45141_c0_g1_i1:304-606(+)
MFGVPLTAAEEEARDAFRKKFCALTTEQSIPAAVALLGQGASQRKVAPKLMEGAIVHLEQLYLEGKLASDGDLSIEQLLRSSYRLCFSTGVSSHSYRRCH